MAREWYSYCEITLEFEISHTDSNNSICSDLTLRKFIDKHTVNVKIINELKSICSSIAMICLIIKINELSEKGILSF